MTSTTADHIPGWADLVSRLSRRVAGRAVVAALSGGVDSTVAAAAAVAAGADVHGIWLRLWTGPANSASCSTADAAAASAAAAALGIPFTTSDAAADFDTHVIDTHRAGADRGATTNPCLDCNRHVKARHLARYADSLASDALVVTGHHATISHDTSGRAWITGAADAAKDQRYVLAGIATTSLAQRLVLPVGHLPKATVRAVADAYGFAAAAAPDSMDLCFNRADVLGPARPGRVIDHETGRTLGPVHDTRTFTIGQRRIGMSAGDGTARAVTRIDPDAGVVTVAAPTRLTVRTMTADDWTTAAGPVTGETFGQLSAHGRQHHIATIGHAAGSVTVTFTEAVRRTGIGQDLMVVAGQGTTTHDGVTVPAGAVVARGALA